MNPQLVDRPLRAWVHYHVLSHLDLGADAANLYIPGQRARWAEPLLAAYRRAPDRLRLQHTPITRQSTEDPQLLAAFEQARAAVWSAVEAAWERDDAFERNTCFHRDISPALMACRRAAYGDVQPPLLLVYDVPALGRHGRGARAGDARVVATSLAEPVEHVFCQVLHEEMHPITDPLVAEMFEGVDLGARDTHVGGAGYTLHRALEVAAVEGGRQIVEQAAPQFADAYARWCAAHGMSAAES